MFTLWVDTNGVDGLERLVSFLYDLGIDVEYIQRDPQTNYSRTIRFTINNRVYCVLWFNNESKLYIGSQVVPSKPSIVFRYVHLNTSRPIGGGFKNNLSFGNKMDDSSVLIPLFNHINR